MFLKVFLLINSLNIEKKIVMMNKQCKIKPLNKNCYIIYFIA